MELEELRVLITAETQGLRRELNNLRAQLGGLNSSADRSTSGIKSAFGGLKKFLIALGIGKVIKDSITEGMDSVESENLFSVSLGNMADEARKWSMELQNSLGLNGYDVRKNLGVLYTMTSSMGLTQNAAYGLSQDMTKLAYDMASFYNLSDEDAFVKIRAGLTGETEPLRQLGIIVDEATIKQYAYKNGIAESGSELTNQQKVMARYQAILAQTSKAQGDLARTINSPANQLRLLKTNLQLLQIELGRAFLPVLQIILPILTSFVKGLTQTMSVIAQFSQNLFGSAVNSVSTKISDTSVAAYNGASAQSDYADSLSATGDAAKQTAKELKGLAGFDEINSLNNSDTSGGGGSGGVDTVSTPTTSTPDTSSIENSSRVLADKIKSYFATFDFSNLINAFDRFKTSIKPIVDDVGSALMWFLDNVLDPLAHWTLQDSLPAFLDLLAGALDFLRPTVEGSDEGLKWLWDNFLQPIASWTGGVIVSVLEDLGKVLSSIGDSVSEHKTMIADFTIVLASFAAAWGIVTIATTIWTAISWLATYGTTALGVAMLSIDWPIVLAIAAIGALIAAGILLYKHWDDVKRICGEVWDWIQAKFQAFDDWIGNIFTTDWTNHFGVFGNVINAFMKTASDIWDSIKRIFSGIIDFVAGVFTGDWSRAWNGVKDIFGGIFDGLVAVAKAPLNLVIAIINGAIDGINFLIKKIDSISFDLPKILGGGHVGFDIPSLDRIPYLAKGGIVDNPTLAMVGEAGKEAVVPLENNTGWMDKISGSISNAVLQAIMFNNSSSRNNQSNGSGDVYLDSTKVGQVLYKSIKNEEKRMGNIYAT